MDRIKSQGRDANPYFRLMGIEVTAIKKGEACLSMDIQPEMLNGAGWLQGGIFTALADEAMALALCTLTAREERIATATETTTFIKGARHGGVVAVGRVVKRGRRMAFTEGDVREKGSRGELLTRTSAAFIILQ